MFVLYHCFTLVACLVTAWAQFPAECVMNATTALQDRTCCPYGCSGHGTCTDITNSDSADWSTITGYGEEYVELINQARDEYNRVDTRYQWPTEVFQKVCVCELPYSGADCSECDFGYIMNPNGVCEKGTALRVRKNYVNLTPQERADFIKVLNESKNEDESLYKWAVIVEEPIANDSSGEGLKLESVATYDLFTFHHALAKREGDVQTSDSQPVCGDMKVGDSKLSDVDFAHESSGFLTWHRYYLLLYERELGRIAERLKEEGRISSSWTRYNFALPYWDWSESAIEEIFQNSTLGSLPSKLANAEGNLFENWTPVCNKHFEANMINDNSDATCEDIRRPCNVRSDRDNNQSKRLQRGVFHLRGRDALDEQKLPGLDTIKYLIDTDTYDATSAGNPGRYGVGSKGISFRNRLEGFVNLTAGEFSEYGEGAAHNNFHNSVHIYIHGHMRIIPSATNDPVFYLHHGNVDRLLEIWLRNRGRNTSYIPGPEERVAHPGHNSKDYLVPFFPLKTNKDMYHTSDMFGYEYDDLESPTDSDDDGGTLVLANIFLLLGGAVTAFLIIGGMF